MSESANEIAGKRLLSRAELRKFVNVSDQTLHRWQRAHKFVPPIRIGNRRFYRQDLIEQWLEENGGDPR
jgi:DNA-binding transcriptional MerR regulator